MVEASYINASNAENMKNVWHVIKHTADRTVEGSKMQATASGIESKQKKTPSTNQHNMQFK